MIEQNKSSLSHMVAPFPNVRALCIGDIILDTFNTGTVKRISPECPVPVFESGEVQKVAGGAAMWHVMWLHWAQLAQSSA